MTAHDVKSVGEIPGVLGVDGVTYTAMKPDLETLLEEWRGGNREAGEQVIALVYPDLRALAGYFLSKERPGHTLQPTDLVNEAYVRLTSGKPISPQNRAHFVALASRQMRRVLIDHARSQKALKRNDTMITIFLSDAADERRPGNIESVLTIDEILQELESHDARAAQIVEYRVFGGLTEQEIAMVVDVSVATVKRDWTFARAWLIRKLRGESGTRAATAQ